MIRLLALGLLGGASLMSSAIAAPCVGAGFDVPFPGAVGVETRHADVPSAQFPGLWQQGQIDGYAYQVFANTTGVLQEFQSPSAWSIALDCQQSLCIREIKGSPPGLAWTASQRLERCLAPPVVAVPVAPPEPAMVTATPKPATPKPATPKPAPTKPALTKPAPIKPAAQPVPTKPAPAEPALTKPALTKPALTKPAPTKPAPTKPAPTKPAPAEPVPTNPTPIKPATTASSPLAPAAPTVSAKTADKQAATERRLEPQRVDQCVGPQDLGSAAADCSLASIPEADPVVMLQRLLVLAGADPGVVDGAYGRQTQQAVLQVLGFAGRNLEVPEAIFAVKAFLCQQKR